MTLNKKALGTSILTNVKGTNKEIVTCHLDKFAVVENKNEGTTMICFTVKEHEGKYFWASTSLYEFLNDNVENAVFDGNDLTYEFPDDEVIITHCGKTPLKSDKTRSANVWRIECR